MVLKKVSEEGEVWWCNTTPKFCLEIGNYAKIISDSQGGSEVSGGLYILS